MSYLALGVHEYAGLTAADGCTGALGQSVTPTAALTTTAPDLLFSIAVEDSIPSGISLTPPAGFTALENLANAAPPSAPYADAHSLQALPSTVAASWALSPSQSWICMLAGFKTANTQPTLIAKLTYDDGTPFAGSAVLYLEGATETQVATAPLDVAGKVFTTFAIDPTKSYRVVVDDTLGNLVAEGLSPALPASISQSAIAYMASTEFYVVVSKLSGTVMSVTPGPIQ